MKKSLTANNHIQQNSRNIRLTLKILTAFKYANNKHAIKKVMKTITVVVTSKACKMTAQYQAENTHKIMFYENNR